MRWRAGSGRPHGIDGVRGGRGGPDLTLVAAVDPKGAGGRVGAGWRSPPTSMPWSDAGAEVAVDFTVAAAAAANAAWCAAHGIHAVIGTTGLDAAALAALADAFPADGRTGCVVAPNFAIGAVLMMRFAELAAPWFESAEIIELHHDAKVDAPSGTALLTANRMAAASADWGADPDPGRGGRRRPGRRGPGGHPHPLGAPAGPGRPPGGRARHRGPEPDHSP